MLKSVAFILSMFWLYTASAQRQVVDLQLLGFHSGFCEAKQGARFIDDNLILLTAPAEPCDRSNRYRPSSLTLTVIDLQGRVTATKPSSAVVMVGDGPKGFAAVCTTNTVELLGADLMTGKVLLTGSDPDFCRYGVKVAPAREAISILKVPGTKQTPAEFQLLSSPTLTLIAELELKTDQTLVAVGDAGYAVCEKNAMGACTQLIVNGTPWADGFKGSVFGNVLFITSTQLLFPPFSSVVPSSVFTPSGKVNTNFDLRKYRPINVDSQSLQISADSPRRLVYSATGCYIGDFDDCYGLPYGRIVVLDSGTQKAIFDHKVSASAESAISADGHHLLLLDHTKLEIFTLR